MEELRAIDDSSFDDAVRLTCDAYPGDVRATGASRDRVRELMKRALEDPRLSYWGLFREGRMVGFMRYHDLKLNCRGTVLPGGGVGGVAVDLLHKRQGVAKSMMQRYLAHYRDNGTSLALLWPFRPDFYHNMGFGTGAKMYVYNATPDSLPASEERHHCRFLAAEDIPDLVQMHNALAMHRHGMAEENEHTFRKVLRPEANVKLLGYERDGRLEGYAQILFGNFDPRNFVKYDLRVHFMLYLTPRALSGMLGFFHSQFDQVRRVRITSPDDSFQYLLSDPRDDSDVIDRPVFHQTNTAGVGIMFRVLDLDALLSQLTTPAFSGRDLTLGITIKDSFLPEMNGRWVVSFREGRGAVTPEASADAEIAMPIAEFSSLFMGAVPFARLCEYGLASIDKPELIPTVTALFTTEEPPFCLTSF